MDAMLTGADVQATASADQLASDLLRNHESTKFLDGVVPMLLNFRLPPEAIASLVIGQTFVGTPTVAARRSTATAATRWSCARGRLELGR